MPRPGDGRGRSGEAHSFLAEKGCRAARSSQGRTRRCERSDPLTASTALENFREEGMAPLSFARKNHVVNRKGGNHDDQQT
jgi:hypothetical protein